METATVDGITSTSASESAEQITAALSHDEAAPAVESTESPAAEPAKPAKKGSYQARIDDLTAQLANKAQGEAAVNEKLAKIDALERKLATLEARPAGRQPDPPPKSAEDAEPTEDQFESYKDFVKAQAKWEIRQELAQRDRISAQRQHAFTAEQRDAEVMQAFQSRLETAKTTIPNFEAVLASSIPLSRPMQDVIKQSEIGPQLMAHLHEHPEEHARIYGAGNPLEVFRQMNKLEARLEGAVSSGPPLKAKPISTAKPPIKPLGAASSVMSDEPPGDDASFEAHERYWNAKETEKARQGRQ